MIRTLTGILCIALVLAFVSFAALAQDWGFVVNGHAGPVKIAADSSGNRIITTYAGGGYWLTENGGADWTPYNTSISTDVMLDAEWMSFVDPAGQIMQAHCYFLNDWDAERHSLDGGETWSTFDFDPFWPDTLGGPGSGAWKILYEPDGRIYFACQHGFAYNDSWGTWWSVADYEDIVDSVEDIFVHPDNPNTVFVYGYWTDDDLQTGEPSGGIVASFDGGATWARVTPMEDLTQVPTGHVTSMAMLPDGTLIAVLNQGYTFPQLQLLRSTNGGITWEWFPYQGLPDNMLLGEIVAVPEVPGRLFVNANSVFGVWQSDDSGATWTRVEAGLPISPEMGHDLYRNPFSGHLYVSLYEQGIYRSTDFGETWTELPGPPVGVITAGQYAAPTSADGFWFNSTGGNAWFASGNSTEFTQMTELPSPEGRTFLNGFALPEGMIGYLKRQYDQATLESTISIKWSLDGGNSWAESAATDYGSGDGFYLVNAFEVEDELLLMGSNTYNNRVYLSEDMADTWTPVNFLGRQLAFIRQHRGQFYALDAISFDVVRSSSIGETWVELDFPDPTSLMIFASPMRSLNDTLYVTGYMSMWALLPDDTWQQRGDLGGYSNTWDLATTDTDTFMVSRISGPLTDDLYVSHDLGFTWQQQDLEYPWPNQSSHIVNVMYDEFRQRLWVDTGVGLAYLDFAENLVHDPWVLHPAEYEVLTAYPNPFNASTTIRFTLDAPQQVKLDVFDVLGRHVASLADGLCQPGVHEINFDASDLSSGSYFLRYASNVTTFERKLVLLK